MFELMRSNNSPFWGHINYLVKGSSTDQLIYLNPEKTFLESFSFDVMLRLEKCKLKMQRSNTVCITTYLKLIKQYLSLSGNDSLPNPHDI